MPFQKLINLYQKLLNSGDPRTNSWPFIRSPMPTVVLILAYLYFVKIAGPKWMKNKPAFGLRKTMIVYNFAMVILSTYLFVEMGRLLNWGIYCLECQKIDYSRTERANKFLELGYYFYLSKFIEFIDTIFFVLRKKNNQISSLHVYHHAIVPITMQLGMKFEPGANNSLFPFLNSGVHSLMYTYYGLSALGPQFQKYLFWKRYITTIQLSQFTIVLLHSLKNFLSGCEGMSFFLFVNFFHASVFFYLFASFYIKSYAKRLTKSVNAKRDANEDKKTKENSQVIKDGIRLRTVKDENSNTITSY